MASPRITIPLPFLALVSLTLFQAGDLRAQSQPPPGVRVRVDFRTLKVLNTTGDEVGNDQPYVKVLKTLPGTMPAWVRFPASGASYSAGAGKYVWDGDSRKIIWEGNLQPGQAAAFIVNVMEDDGSPPNWRAWLGSGTSCTGALATTAASAGATAPSLLSCASLGMNIIKALNGDDLVGQFTVVVKNENGVVKKSLHTASPRTQIGGYTEPALSDSKKTIRVECGQGTKNDQRYLASLQVRQLTDMIADEGGTALEWTVIDENDAR